MNDEPARTLIPSGVHLCPACGKVIGDDVCPDDPTHVVEPLFRSVESDKVFADVRLVWDFTQPDNVHIVADDADLVGLSETLVAEGGRLARTRLEYVTWVRRARRNLAEAREALLREAGWDGDNGTVGSGACASFESNPLGKCSRCGWAERDHLVVEAEIVEDGGAPALEASLPVVGRSLGDMFRR